MLVTVALAGVGGLCDPCHCLFPLVWVLSGGLVLHGEEKKGRRRRRRRRRGIRRGRGRGRIRRRKRKRKKKKKKKKKKKEEEEEEEEEEEISEELKMTSLIHIKVEILCTPATIFAKEEVLFELRNLEQCTCAAILTTYWLETL